MIRSLVGTPCPNCGCTEMKRETNGWESGAGQGNGTSHIDTYECGNVCSTFSIDADPEIVDWTGKCTVNAEKKAAVSNFF